MDVLVAETSDRTITGLWWVNLVEAVVAIFFGIVAVFWPGITLLVLLYLFSGFILAMGIVEAIGGFMSRRVRTSWWTTALLGLVGVGVGIYLLRHPNVTLHVFIIILGLTLIARGLIDIVKVFIDRSSGGDKVLWTIIGLAGITIGIIVLVQPVSSGIAFVWLLGLYAIVVGILSMVIALDLQVKHIHHEQAIQDTRPQGSVQSPSGKVATKGNRS